MQYLQSLTDLGWSPSENRQHSPGMRQSPAGSDMIDVSHPTSLTSGSLSETAADSHLLSQKDPYDFKQTVLKAACCVSWSLQSICHSLWSSTEGQARGGPAVKGCPAAMNQGLGLDLLILSWWLPRTVNRQLGWVQLNSWPLLMRMWA